MRAGPREAEPFRTEFLLNLMRRGLRGVKVETSAAHEDLKASVAEALKSTGQR